MPVRQISNSRSSDHLTLVGQLLSEWTNPIAAEEPVILEELDNLGQLSHLYVVWSEWSHLDSIERSEIIMDAAAKKLSPDQALSITVAMGLTPAEADHIGLQWR